MPVIDFDMGLAARVGDVYSSPGIPVEFMPEDMFERKRIVDKITDQDTFSFISFWRSGYVFDPNRWDPASMFSEYTYEGYYNDVDKTSATLFNFYPVIFTYNFVFWDTKREQMDYSSSYLFKNLYRSPITHVHASDAIGLLMNCYMDFEYKLDITDEYILEKSEKVPYFKGKFDLKLEGWLYDITDTGDSGSPIDLIQYIHTFVYNQNNFHIGDIWVPDEKIPDPGLPSGYPDGSNESANLATSYKYK
jgi:hypothetical protein